MAVSGRGWNGRRKEGLWEQPMRPAGCREVPYGTWQLQSLGVPAALKRSGSGNGGHVPVSQRIHPCDATAS